MEREYFCKGKVKTYTITLSNKQKYVYFQIAKTGTRTAVNFLHERTDIKMGFPWRVRRDGYCEEYKQKWNDYFKFTIVRNPWDRLLSYYLNKVYVRGRPWMCKPKYRAHKGMTFKELIQALYQENLKTCDIHYRLQTHMFPQSKVDFIGRFENYQEDFNTICDKIGIPQQQLPHKNSTKHKHYTEYYDDETKQIVAEKYAKDIEYFGYEFGE